VAPCRQTDEPGEEELRVMTVRWCGECREEQLFEVPPCADGHGEDCPDLACTGCGLGIVVGVLEAEVAPERLAA
jgi:hypothetical protein